MGVCNNINIWCYFYMYSSYIKYVLNIHMYWDLYTYIMDTSGCSHFIHCIEIIYSSKVKLIQCHIITVALQSSRRLFPFQVTIRIRINMGVLCMGVILL